MANTKITELTAYTNPAATDVLPIVDVTADSTKKIEFGELFKSVGDGTDAAPAIAFDSESDTGIYRPGADQIAISTGGTNRLTLDGSGASTYLRLSANCAGIQFDGNTSSDQALDDYEEGTFTPAIQGSSTNGTASYVYQLGSYTKIGNQVSFHIRLQWFNHSGQGNMKVIGLPFVSKTSMYYPVSAVADAITLDTSSANNPSTFHAMVGPATNNISLYECTTDVAAIDLLSMDAAGTIFLGGTYFT